MNGQFAGVFLVGAMFACVSQLTACMTVKQYHAEVKDLQQQVDARHQKCELALPSNFDSDDLHDQHQQMGEENELGLSSNIEKGALHDYRQLLEEENKSINKVLYQGTDMCRGDSPMGVSGRCKRDLQKAQAIVADLVKQACPSFTEIAKEAHERYEVKHKIAEMKRKLKSARDASQPSEESLVAFKKAGCIVPAYELFEIVQKVGAKSYELATPTSIVGGQCMEATGCTGGAAVLSGRHAMLETTDTTFNSTGRLPSDFYVREAGVKKVKMTDGFDEDVLVLREAPDCKKILAH